MKLHGCLMYRVLVSAMLLKCVLGGNSIRSASTPGNDSSSPAPEAWARFCHGRVERDKHEIDITCNVRDGDAWDFNTFRNWSNQQPNGTSVSLHVFCGVGAFLRLPWPFRAMNLRRLIIRSCLIKDYFSEIGYWDILKIPDSLEILDIIDSTIEVDVKYLQIDTSSFPQQFECGPLKLTRNVYRNFGSTLISGSFSNYNVSDTNLTDSLNQRTRSEPRHICDMKNLRVWEYTDITNSSPFFFKKTISNSRYPQLRMLNLSNTREQTIPPSLKTWRYKFPRLQFLDLSHNNITRFDEIRDLSDSTEPVGIINLTYNNIKTVTEREREVFQKVKKVVIDIRHNNLTCDCAMSGFSEFLRKYETPEEAGLHPNYTYLWKLKCITPEHFAGRTISSFSRKELCSNDVSGYIAQIVSLSIVVAVLLMIIVLMMRYRQEIRILAFTRLHMILPCQQVEENSSKQYDAFISYSHLDMDWVVKTFLPRLESAPSSEGHFRLCLHQRDFAVGAAIADNIVQSVESSRHTILVLSKNFVQSEWCLMEFRTAFHQSLLEKKKHLIIVLLEDLPVKELDPDLRRCLQTWTYVKASDRLFWDRIVYSLTDKRQRRSSGSSQVDKTERINPCKMSTIESSNNILESV